ncbi:MAG: hypothetical protein K0S24_3309 [Sphingobacterium sp.]|jgi:hypothetical protein|nr:hypothetical protein [Sphingobacterium sp.]
MRLPHKDRKRIITAQASGVYSIYYIKTGKLNAYRM